MGDFTASALRMLADIIDDAKRTGSDDFSVIPIVVEGLLEYYPLIEAALRFNGTRLAERDCYEGIDLGSTAVPDAKLVSLVESIPWLPLPDGTSRDLKPSWPNQILRVRFGEAQSPAPQNPGDRASLSLYTSLLQPGFDTDIGAIAYDETFMDEDARVTAWQTVLDTLPALMKGPDKPNFCRTLLVFVGVAAVEWDRHCRPGAEGARYLCGPAGISKRLPWGTIQNATLRIAEQKRPLVLYLGAGASVSSELPTGDALRDKALERLEPAQKDKGFPAMAKAFFADVKAQNRLMSNETMLNEDGFIERLTLERVLREEIKQHTSSGLSPTLAEFKALQESRLNHPGPTISVLRQALRSRERLVLLTVNFDQLVEHGATILRGWEPDSTVELADGEPAVRMFVTDDELKQFPSYFEHYRTNGGVIPFLKLHGSIESEDVRANVDDTIPGLPDGAIEALQCLADPDEPITWVYVGCSMRDLDVQMVTNEPRFARGTDEFWVAPVPDRHVLSHVNNNRTAAWAKNDRLPVESRLLTWTSDEFFGVLAPNIVPG